MTVVIRNVSHTMDEIFDTKTGLDRIGMAIATLNLNFTYALAAIYNNENQVSIYFTKSHK